MKKKLKLKPVDINDIVFVEKQKQEIEELQSTIKLKSYVEPKIPGLNTPGDLKYCNLNVNKYSASHLYKMLRYHYDDLVVQWEPITQTQKKYLKDMEAKLQVLKKIVHQD